MQSPDEHHFQGLTNNRKIKSLFLILNKYFHIYKFTLKVSKGAKIRNRYYQVPHLTQDTNGKVANSQLDATNESKEVSPFPADDHKAHINRRAQMHSIHKTERKENIHKRSTALERSVKYFKERFSLCTEYKIFSSTSFQVSETVMRNAKYLHFSKLLFSYNEQCLDSKH